MSVFHAAPDGGAREQQRAEYDACDGVRPGCATEHAEAEFDRGWEVAGETS